MHEDRFWLLLSLKLSGEALPEELDELNVLLHQNPELGLQAETINNVWVARLPGLNRKEESYNKHMQRLSNHFSEPVLQYETSELITTPPDSRPAGYLKKHRWIPWMSGIAASILIAWLVLSTNGEIKKPGSTTPQNTVSTKRGSKSKIQLPDGTQVWLNADSKLTYNESFLGKIREVQLTGEAFFDVVRDETRPFLIHTNTIDVKVLGTAFNVRSYANEKNTETSLIRGSVEITLRDNPDKKIVLKPNEKLIVQNNTATLTRGTVTEKENESGDAFLTLRKINYQEKDSSVIETLWVKNKLAFDNEALEDIALKIERWYDVKVVINNEQLKKITYTAVFEDESLQQVMEALAWKDNFRYSINKKEVLIRP